MIPWWKWGISGLLVIISAFSPVLVMNTLATDWDWSMKKFRTATLEKRIGDALVFVTYKGGRIWIIRGQVSYETKIPVERNQEINVEVLQNGS